MSEANYWWEQRYDDALFQAREDAGLCGNCGEPHGVYIPHLCPKESE